MAADESLGTIKKRFDALGIESTPEIRRTYRDMLFSTPDIARYISGIILFEETLDQRSSSGMVFPEFLASLGIIPGIKVDKGTVPMRKDSPETLTEGLDGLAQRLASYKSQGARFAKWRGVIHIQGQTLPTTYAIAANAAALAHYARLCQDIELMPIVEPEVLMDGRQDISRSAAVTEMTLAAVFDALRDAGVCLEGMLLKPNMVVSGAVSGEDVQVGQVAEQTLQVLRRCVPAAVPGVIFLSGGQAPDIATTHLREIVQHGGVQPWRLTYSYGRALQDEALTTWSGKADNTAKAQVCVQRRAAALSAASVR